MAKGWKCLLLLSMSLLMTTDVQGATYSNLETLVTALFASYKPELRPFLDDTNATFVYMGIWLAAIQVYYKHLFYLYICVCVCVCVCVSACVRA